MSQQVDLTGQKFNHWTVLEELGNGKILCQCDCENQTVKILDKYSVKKGKSTSCGCSKAFEKFKGKQFGYWTVIEDIDKDYSLCRCICGKEKKVQRAHLKNGTSISCGCKKAIKNDITGQTINYWTVLKELGAGKVLCQCICGTQREVYKNALLNGTTKSCGCKSSELKSEAFLNNMEGQTINSWTILKELGNDKVFCRCSCGVEKVTAKSTILDGRSKSCGHDTNAFRDLTKQKFGEWTVLKELGYGKVECQCSCENKTIKILDKATLLNGTSQSCGCKKREYMLKTIFDRYGEVSTNKINNPREQWQIDAVSSRENMINYITHNFNHKPTVYELTKTLGINESSIGRKIKEYDIANYVDLQPMHSKYEDELVDYVKSIYSGKLILNSKGIITPYELDIYIPEKKLAIEFNGNYWHSTIYKDKYYHQQKTIKCAKQGIRLIHIFEYEWKNSSFQEKIKNCLKQILTDSNIIYARNTEVKEISASESKPFLEKYHFQNDTTSSSIRLGCFYKDKLVGVMTFGKPRFNNKYEYELHRLCWRPGIKVVGGLEKLFSYFTKTYNPQSVLTYSDISKFAGNSYTKIGFTPVQPNPITEPNYKWVSPTSNDVLSRYQTQKYRLLEQGLGTEDQTEDEIMEDNNYFKIYDCGSIALQWAK
jgi:hypothetical protein